MPSMSVDEQFRRPQEKPYPPDNDKGFEEWFYENYDPAKNLSDRVYLPVFWTAYYVRHKYGRYKPAIDRLQGFINSLDRTKKYFTIVQYDDGILNRMKDLDIKIFGMGCKGDYQLPLISKPHKYDFSHLPKERSIFASFVGRETHPIRTEMIKELKGKEGYYISTETTGLEHYCYILSQSVFALCPRGYGKTSFRIQESLQYGAIPVYISEEFLLPHNLRDIIVTGSPGKFADYDYLFANLDAIGLQYNLKEIYYTYFTYEANLELIYKNL